MSSRYNGPTIVSGPRWRCGWKGCRELLSFRDVLCPEHEAERKQQVGEMIQAINDGTAEITVCRGPHLWEDFDE